MKKHIEEKITHLRAEIKAIDYTSSVDNLIMTEYDNQRILELKSKIQVLNEIIMTYEINNVEYEHLFVSTETCPIDGWYPIETSRIKEPEKIEEFIKQGILRKII